MNTFYKNIFFFCKVIEKKVTAFYIWNISMKKKFKAFCAHLHIIVIHLSWIPFSWSCISAITTQRLKILVVCVCAPGALLHLGPLGKVSIIEIIHRVGWWDSMLNLYTLKQVWISVSFPSLKQTHVVILTSFICLHSDILFSFSTSCQPKLKSSFSCYC